MKTITSVKLWISWFLAIDFTIARSSHMFNYDRDKRTVSIIKTIRIQFPFRISTFTSRMSNRVFTCSTDGTVCKLFRQANQHDERCDWWTYSRAKYYTERSQSPWKSDDEIFAELDYDTLAFA